MDVSRNSTADVWGERTPQEGDWPQRVDYHLADTPDRWVQSACVLCSNGCALDIGVKDGRIVGVRGREQDRVNRGRLGPKGLHGWEANGSPERLTTPLIRRNGELEPASWDEAMDLIVQRSTEIRDRYTSGAIGFYTTGQLFLEEYYTLAVTGKAGFGTPHMDGNTRLCTATAAAALKETFGSDGQPASYSDIDVTDAILHVGHNIASTQTVLWARILDRRRGPNPPRLVVIDPRRTTTAAEADIHLAPQVGTNVPVLNGLLNLIIENGWTDREFIERHTIGFGSLHETVQQWMPERVESVSGVPAAQLREAAEAVGQADSLVSTVLQGVYQSMQATSAAVQVNNLNLIRGLIGNPGSGVLQMNGQPTAQNTRECGADGDMPGFRNWHNPEHIRELAALWNVDHDVIPAWKPPTHALELFRYAEKGSLRMLWITATNPAVSLPDLGRVRSILQREGLFVVAQDAFMTETTELADVVLPAALWGEKTGCFTNADRTVHISHKAVDPPGEARADLDILIDYARRMDFRDRDGEPLIKWCDPAGAFEAWRECTRGRPCDYSGLSYEKLTGGSGIQWPCNDTHPDGTERLYTDGQFPTRVDTAEDFGHDLVTGAATSADEFKAMNPDGRAILKPADYQPPHDQPDEAFPFWLTTGRVVYHFHTRTKTGRSEALTEAEPDAFVEIGAEDAERLALTSGDMVEVETRRGRVWAPLRIGELARGHLFVPFHYGYWDDAGRPRAVNETTLYEWDPVSKQPYYKHAGARVRRVTQAESEKAEFVPVNADSATSPPAEEPRSHVADYVGVLEDSERALAEALEQVAEAHAAEPDVLSTCKLLARESRTHLEQLREVSEKYGERPAGEPRRVRDALFSDTGSPIKLLRDLHDVRLLAGEAHISQVILQQTALALRDRSLQNLLDRMAAHNRRQRSWLETRLQQAAPQSLTVPS